MGDYDPVRDCLHGSQVGKCDTCELIAAEKRIKALEAENERLKGQNKLMQEKAAVSFNLFWNGGWYSISEQPKAQEQNDETNTN